MTTLFNLFCPYVIVFPILESILTLVFSSLFMMVVLLGILMTSCIGYVLSEGVKTAFPLSSLFSFIIVFFGLVLALLNLLSMVLYSFPVTTSLSFNFSAALSFWLSGVLIQSMSNFSTASILPINSPWYLIPFLSVVELISIMVRPVTLCFRLLANMSAGHILLTLICKMSVVWCLGTMFGLLELMVSVVQAFVFLMLISVYLEEAMSH